jgi:hypothetical protein
MDTRTGITQDPHWEQLHHMHGVPANSETAPVDIADTSSVDVSAVGVRRLTGAHEIGEIQFLREEIDLELHRRRDPAFTEHEKKEIC